MMSENAKRNIAILVIKTAQQVSPSCCGNAKAGLKVVSFCSNGVVVLQGATIFLYGNRVRVCKPSKKNR
jgi:hypothetical protein